MIHKSLWRFWSSLGIRYKITAILTAVLTAGLVSVSALSLRQQRRVLEAENRGRVDRLLDNASAAAKGALSGSDSGDLKEFMERIGRRADVVRLVVRDGRGRIVAEQRRTASPTPASRGASFRDASYRRSIHEGEAVLEVRAPVYPGEKAARPLGSVEMTFSERRVRESLSQQRNSLLVLGGLFSAVGLLVSFGLGAVLTRKISVLAGLMDDLSHGRPDGLAKISAHDEIGRLGRSFNRMVLKMREKSHMEKYLSRSTLQQVHRMRASRSVRLGGERRRVAVLFSDIRGFTEFAEKMEAEVVVETLNVYLNTQSEVITKRGGSVDKFVGDQVMAIFTGERAEFQAALSAQEIVNFVASLNETRARRGLPVLAVGVGLNVGEVVMGNMGAERRMDYTVVGDPINTAARLCGKARPGQVVMSWPLLSALSGRCRWGMLEKMAVKGKRAPVEVYELKDLPGAARRHMRRHVDKNAWAFLPARERFAVRVDDLSRTGCAVEIAAPIPAGSELDLELPPEIVGTAARVRAEVCHVKARSGFFRAGLKFKGVPEEFSHEITEWVHHIDMELAVRT